MRMRITSAFFFFSSWWWRGLCIQTVFNSGRLSVIPREQQHLQHLSSSQKCKFWSLIPDLPASAALGVGLGHLRLNEALKVRLRCARLRSRAMDLPAAFPLSDPHQPARGRGILETQHLGLHPRSTESELALKLDPQGIQVYRGRLGPYDLIICIM